MHFLQLFVVSFQIFDLQFSLAENDKKRGAPILKVG